MTGQICSTCNVFKSFELFHKRKDKYRAQCKNCRSIYMKQYRQNNIEKCKLKDKLFYEKNKSIIIQKNQNYRQQHSQSINQQKKIYYKQNIENIKRYHEHNKTKRNAYLKYRKQVDPSFKIKCVLQSRLSYLLKNKKTKKYNDIIGCNNETLKDWLEFQFIDGMDWDNHGILWDIDHVIPISSFNLLNEENHKCFHWTNLQPLYHVTNMVKANHIYNDMINNHNIKLVNYTLNSEYQSCLEIFNWLRETTKTK